MDEDYIDADALSKQDEVALRQRRILYQHILRDLAVAGHLTTEADLSLNNRDSVEEGAGGASNQSPITSIMRHVPARFLDQVTKELMVEPVTLKMNIETNAKGKKATDEDDGQSLLPSATWVVDRSTSVALREFIQSAHQSQMPNDRRQNKARGGNDASAQLTTVTANLALARQIHTWARATHLRLMASKKEQDGASQQQIDGAKESEETQIAEGQDLSSMSPEDALPEWGADPVISIMVRRAEGDAAQPIDSNEEVTDTNNIGQAPEEDGAVGESPPSAPAPIPSFLLSHAFAVTKDDVMRDSKDKAARRSLVEEERDRRTAIEKSYFRHLFQIEKEEDEVQRERATQQESPFLRRKRREARRRRHSPSMAEDSREGTDTNDDKTLESRRQAAAPTIIPRQPAKPRPPPMVPATLPTIPTASTFVSSEPPLSARLYQPAPRKEAAARAQELRAANRHQREGSTSAGPSGGALVSGIGILPLGPELVGPHSDGEAGNSFRSFYSETANVDDGSGSHPTSPSPNYLVSHRSGSSGYLASGGATTLVAVARATSNTPLSDGQQHATEGGLLVGRAPSATRRSPSPAGGGGSGILLVRKSSGTVVIGTSAGAATNGAVPDATHASPHVVSPGTQSARLGRSPLPTTFLPSESVDLYCVAAATDVAGTVHAPLRATSTPMHIRQQRDAMLQLKRERQQQQQRAQGESQGGSIGGRTVVTSSPVTAVVERVWSATTDKAQQDRSADPEPDQIKEQVNKASEEMEEHQNQVAAEVKPDPIAIEQLWLRHKVNVFFAELAAKDKKDSNNSTNKESTKDATGNVTEDKFTQSLETSNNEIKVPTINQKKKAKAQDSSPASQNSSPSSSPTRALSASVKDRSGRPPTAPKPKDAQSQSSSIRVQSAAANRKEAPAPPSRPTSRPPSSSIKSTNVHVSSRPVSAYNGMSPSVYYAQLQAARKAEREAQRAAASVQATTAPLAPEVPSIGLPTATSVPTVPTSSGSGKALISIVPPTVSVMSSPTTDARGSAIDPTTLIGTSKRHFQTYSSAGLGEPVRDHNKSTYGIHNSAQALAQSARRLQDKPGVLLQRQALLRSARKPLASSPTVPFPPHGGTLVARQIRMGDSKKDAVIINTDAAKLEAKSPTLPTIPSPRLLSSKNPNATADAIDRTALKHILPDSEQRWRAKMKAVYGVIGKDSDEEAEMQRLDYIKAQRRRREYQDEERRRLETNVADEPGNPSSVELGEADKEFLGVVASAPLALDSPTKGQATLAQQQAVRLDRIAKAKAQVLAARDRRMKQYEQMIIDNDLRRHGIEVVEEALATAGSPPTGGNDESAAAAAAEEEERRRYGEKLEAEEKMWLAQLEELLASPDGATAGSSPMAEDNFAPIIAFQASANVNGSSVPPPPPKPPKVQDNKSYGPLHYKSGEQYKHNKRSTNLRKGGITASADPSALRPDTADLKAYYEDLRFRPEFENRLLQHIAWRQGTVYGRLFAKMREQLGGGKLDHQHPVLKKYRRKERRFRQALEEERELEAMGRMVKSMTLKSRAEERGLSVYEGEEDDDEDQHRFGSSQSDAAMTSADDELSSDGQDVNLRITKERRRRKDVLKKAFPRAPSEDLPHHHTLLFSSAAFGTKHRPAEALPQHTTIRGQHRTGKHGMPFVVPSKLKLGDDAGDSDSDAEDEVDMQWYNREGAGVVEANGAHDGPQSENLLATAILSQFLGTGKQSSSSTASPSIMANPQQTDLELPVTILRTQQQALEGRMIMERFVIDIIRRQRYGGTYYNPETESEYQLRLSETVRRGLREAALTIIKKEGCEGNLNIGSLLKRAGGTYTSTVGGLEAPPKQSVNESSPSVSLPSPPATGLGHQRGNKSSRKGGRRSSQRLAKYLRLDTGDEAGRATTDAETDQDEANYENNASTGEEPTKESMSGPTTQQKATRLPVSATNNFATSTAMWDYWRSENVKLPSWLDEGAMLMPTAKVASNTEREVVRFELQRDRVPLPNGAILEGPGKKGSGKQPAPPSQPRPAFLSPGHPAAPTHLRPYDALAAKSNPPPPGQLGLSMPRMGEVMVKGRGGGPLEAAEVVRIMAGTLGGGHGLASGLPISGGAMAWGASPSTAAVLPPRARNAKMLAENPIPLVPANPGAQMQVDKTSPRGRKPDQSPTPSTSAFIENRRRSSDLNRHVFLQRYKGLLDASAPQLPPL